MIDPRVIKYPSQTKYRGARPLNLTFLNYVTLRADRILFTFWSKTQNSPSQLDKISRWLLSQLIREIRYLRLVIL